ncbi:hypothetical protein D3C71_344080 [compost metagenome]
MTTNELFNHIISTHKWYAGKISAQSASRIKKNHFKGNYKNYEWFFGLFGYEKQPDSWTLR